MPAAVWLATVTLNGCGHVPVTSMLRLARIDFANTDPARLRAAVKLPRIIFTAARLRLRYDPAKHAPVYIEVRPC